MKLFLSAVFFCFIPTLIWSQQFSKRSDLGDLAVLTNTTGIAVADYDGDHDLDIFVVAKKDYSAIQPSTWSRLFRNNNDGSFTDVTREAGFANLHDRNLNDPGWELGVKMGASWGDFDNDGFPDLLLTNYNSIQLFKNLGDGTFTEVSQAVGFPASNDCYYYSALWWDVDRDGWLDLFAPNWLGCTGNQYYHNNRDGTFTEIAEQINLQGNIEGGLMSIPIDANLDGLWDIYVANDFDVNQLYIQNQDGTFSEQSQSYQVDYNGNDMGIALGDYNNDGRYEIYITNISENRLMVPNSDHTAYENLAEQKGILNTYWGWDTRFVDVDLDGDEDLIALNGYESDNFFYSVLKENFLFRTDITEGQTEFTDISVEAGIHENGNSISMATFDYDNDGDHDLLISNTDDRPFFYENTRIHRDNSESANWISLHLKGTVSNADGLGSELIVWTNGNAQRRLYYGAGFMSQSLQAVHFGLADAQQIDSLVIRWNNGLIETYFDLPANKHIQLVENQGYTILELTDQKIWGCTQAMACNFDDEATIDDGSCFLAMAPEIVGPSLVPYLSRQTYSCPIVDNAMYNWSISHGEILSGQGTSTVEVKWEMAEAGELRVFAETPSCRSETATLSIDLHLGEDPQYSVARYWNEALLLAIRNDFARPTVHARNLFHTSVAMYDAWAAIDPIARNFLLGQKVGEFESEFSGFSPIIPAAEAKDMAISYAAYTLLRARFFRSPGSEQTLPFFDRLMGELGYDIAYSGTDYPSGNPADLGIYIANTLIEFGFQDGSNEQANYSNRFYESANPPLIPNQSGNSTDIDPNRWQTLALETFIDQSGNLIEGSTPEFLSPEWGAVIPFALSNNDAITYQRAGQTYRVFHDPGAPPYFENELEDNLQNPYHWGFALVALWGTHLSKDDGVLWDISPTGIGNLILQELPTEYNQYPDFYELMEGGDNSPGHRQNPATGRAYESQYVPRGDYARVLAEFWADGPDSETPPGHWFVILNKVSDHELLEKRLGGKGAVLPDLEWDVKSYFILGGTMHDAAIAAWSVKGWYDYIRPVSAIRYMAELGQSSDPEQANYHPEGMPIIPDRIELVAENDPLAGPRGEHIGKIKLYSWLGHQNINDPATEAAGVGWILAENWMPYQRISFVTPPFAGYVSGHSTFSRAAAEAMTLLTGDAYFPGGMGEFIAYKDEFLVFEDGPSQDVRLQWATYRDASDQCSLSRIWGGIHPPADDIPGRFIGEQVGKDAFAFAIPYFYPLAGLDDGLPQVVFPNPTAGASPITITGTTEGMDYQLYDFTGRRLADPIANFQPGLNCTRLEVGNLPSGNYVLMSEEKSWVFSVGQ